MSGAANARLRVAVIGATGRGGYGHGLDTAFQGVDGARLVAVADTDPGGLAKAGKRLGVDRLYRDFRRMLSTEKPDIVCVGPRWLTERVAMVVAAAEAGCHIYCEKPFAADLLSADRMAAACAATGVRLAMAHQWRAIPPVARAITDVRAGKYGRLLRIRVRPKDDRRGGGEELLVHGTHLFDMMIGFAGMPRWTAAHVQVGSRDAVEKDRGEGTEPVGPIAGDSISASFGFDHGVRGYFESTANLSIRGKSKFDNLYGVFVECERALLRLRQPGDVYVYPAPCVLPDFEEFTWEKILIPEWHFTPEHKPRPIRRTWIGLANKTLAANLIDSIHRSRPPISPIANAVAVTEMVQGVYRSHFSAGRRVTIPCADRGHPLGR